MYTNRFCHSKEFPRTTFAQRIFLLDQYRNTVELLKRFNKEGNRLSLDETIGYKAMQTSVESKSNEATGNGSESKASFRGKDEDSKAKGSCV